MNFHVADSGGMQSVVSEMAAALFIAESLSGECGFGPQWTGIACDVSSFNCMLYRIRCGLKLS